MDERKSADTPSVVEQNIANASHLISWKAKEEILGIFHINTSSQVQFNIFIYYMALSHKDWELQNSRIWLAEMDIDRGLDFPI